LFLNIKVALIKCGMKREFFEAKHILRLAFPMVTTQLLWMTMPVVDNMVVGKLGASSLAAMAIATTYYWLLQLLSLGVLSALNPLVAHAFGARKTGHMRSLIHSAMAVAFTLALGMGTLLYWGRPLLEWVGQDPELLIESEKYLRAIVWGVPFYLIFIVLRQFCDSVEDPKPTICLVFVGAILNGVLDFGLVFGLWGLPNLGIAGAGFATATVQVMLCGGLLVYVSVASRFQNLRLWDQWEVNWIHIKEMLRLGLPSSGSMLAEMAYFSGSTLIMGLLGVTAVASHQIALNVASVTFMIPMGVSFAVSVRVGGYAGREDWGGVKMTGTLGQAICLFLGILNASILLIFAEQIVALYSPDAVIRDLSVQLVRIAGVFQIFDGLQVLGIYLLRGIKDTRIPFFNTLISYSCFGMGLSVWLTFYRNMGPVGFWIGMISALALAAFLHQKRFKKLISAQLFLASTESKQ